MNFKTILLALVTLTLGGCVANESSYNQKETIVTLSSLMDEQEKAWNQGDLDGFMSSYWKSDSLAFIGSRGLSKGWVTTLDNYKKSYPTPEKMGRLAFNNLEMEQVSENTAFVIGQWTLFRSQDTLAGHYSLLWKKIAGEWKIVADHSS